MAFRLTIEVSNEGKAPAQVGAAVDPPPSRIVIEFDLPVGGTEQDAKQVARGVRRAFRDVFSARVKVVGFQETGLTRDVEMGAD